MVVTGAQAPVPAPGWVGRGAGRPSALCLLPCGWAVGRGRWAFFFALFFHLGLTGFLEVAGSFTSSFSSSLADPCSATQ